MPIRIYNSLTRKKEEFAPLKKGVANMYTCGVTVYDSCHIGHARSLYIFDVIRKYLGYKGFKVNFVRNITDIDDKIINRAKELGVDWKELVSKYIESYYKDLHDLGIEPGIKDGDHEPRATENIKEMVAFIGKLIEKDYAYEADGDVYFRVKNFKDYGKLSGQEIDKMLEAVRIGADEKKEDALDFALWKKSKEDEPSWSSPWGKGRPGWHIECSVMSTKYLKTQSMDIHAGGRDLIFPHHENEIAQAEALSGETFAKYWIHHGLLTINGQKMAKSAGNFITIQDVLRKYPADVLKMFYLSAHYSSSIDFSWERLQESREALERIIILMDKIDKKVKNCKKDHKKIEAIEEINNKFVEAMDDDFNTPRALSYIFDLVHITNKNIDDLDFICLARTAIRGLLSQFGISAEINFQAAGLSDMEIEAKISERNKARAEKNFKASDEIRVELEEKDIILEDTKEGTTWRRKI